MGMGTLETESMNSSVQLSTLTALPQFISESPNIWVTGMLVKSQECGRRIDRNSLHFLPLSSGPTLPLVSSVEEFIMSQGYPGSSLPPKILISYIIISSILT